MSYFGGKGRRVGMFYVYFSKHVHKFKLREKTGHFEKNSRLNVRRIDPSPIYTTSQLCGLK